jgi:DNA-binding response OmpR family regulator
MVKILLIEPDRILAKKLKSILNDLGFETEMTSTGTQGFEKLKKDKFEIILSNIIPSDISAWEFFTEAVKIQKPDFFFFTGNIPLSEDRINAFRKEGISGYIFNSGEYALFKKIKQKLQLISLQIAC